MFPIFEIKWLLISWVLFLPGMHLHGFPENPWHMLGNKPMIQWVYESASTVFEHLVVATDDDSGSIKAVKDFGGRVVMTSPDHRSGTERCAEAYSHCMKKQTGLNFSHVVNIQGDEPLIKPEQLTTLMDCYESSRHRYCHADPDHLIIKRILKIPMW